MKHHYFDVRDGAYETLFLEVAGDFSRVINRNMGNIMSVINEEGTKDINGIGFMSSLFCQCALLAIKGYAERVSEVIEVDPDVYFENLVNAAMTGIRESERGAKQ